MASVLCGNCGAKNDEVLSSCVNCGALLRGDAGVPPDRVEPRLDAWRLVPKQSGRILDDRGVFLNSVRIDVGRFDADTGPVDVDVSDWPGAETTSRRYARLEFVGVGWKLSDPGSTNGVFVRSPGQERFSARLVEPIVVKGGDEIGLGTLICVLQGPLVSGEGTPAAAQEPAVGGAAPGGPSGGGSVAALDFEGPAEERPVSQPLAVPSPQVNEEPEEEAETSNAWDEDVT
jgi:FHA domain